MKSTLKTAGQSTSIATPLLLIFVVLKLTNVINWSWWWVLSPMLIPVSIGLAIILLAVVVSYFYN
jgi:hypothetical protein